MQNIKVYDSGDKYLDRYAIVLVDVPTHDNYHMILGVDDCGGKYFSNFTEGKDGDHLGKLIDFSEMSAKTQEHVRMRLR